MKPNRVRHAAGVRIVLVAAAALLFLAVVLVPVSFVFIAPAIASVLFPLFFSFCPPVSAAQLAAVRATGPSRGPPVFS